MNTLIFVIGMFFGGLIVGGVAVYFMWLASHNDREDNE
jgi:hypothetical protein